MEQTGTTTYSEWKKAQDMQVAAPASKAEKVEETPQPFENKLQTYVYKPAKDEDTAPAAPAQVQWPAGYSYPSPYAYAQQQHAYNMYQMPYGYGYNHGAYGGAYGYGYPPYPYYQHAQQYAYQQAYYPPQPAKPANPAEEKDKHHTWYGRTRREVEEDNLAMAKRENVFKKDDMGPHDAKPGQLFWVKELDGSTQLYTFSMIESGCKPGKWHTDPRNGNAYFVRAKE
ncbi:hypothetical protein K490DRAFT_62065 [Saccharata proteae CBS 121410]|uniref:Uncharacterized protein n=1 Tax=Saccharata proteae CBS 121410 TaxID=1314787 RepID=A0A9P4M2C4_9PEZI|nr:hypothetical protein K490DRAFT_62065 [Saccharata proteae CBS 121410]